MADVEMSSDSSILQDILQMNDQTKQKQLYKEEAGKRLASLRADAINGLTSWMVKDEVPVAVSRDVMNWLVGEIDKNLTSEDGKHDELLKEVGRFICVSVAARTSMGLDEADYTMRKMLAKVYEDQEDWTEAARILQPMNVENGHREFTEAEKAAHYVSIAELYLQDDLTVEAETVINRASTCVGGMADDWALKLRYQVSYARILDSKRKFLEASLRYHELSTQNNPEILQDDLFALLEKAVHCAILATPGSQRDRLFGALYGDERSQQLVAYPILEKMYKQQLLPNGEVRERLLPKELSKEEIEAGEPTGGLQPHQLAKLADGFTVLEKAVIEHNMTAASNLYQNITFVELGSLLEIEPIKAERFSAKMITENRLTATIDQIEGLLIFEEEGEALPTWDRMIYKMCNNIHDTLEMINKKFPHMQGTVMEEVKS